ncbi:MAG: 3-deoxy-manno-octulosonate-8-phosphatase KdsC [Gammaproteobacteria bacterium]
MAAPQEIIQRATKIKLIAFDVDGILSDGRLILGDKGEEFKAFYTQDGQGLVMLLKAGFELAIITGRSSTIVEERMRELGIKHVYQGVSDKLTVFKKILADTGYSPDQAAYMGDDLPDVPVIKYVALGVTVADAHDFVQQHADLITKNCGGRGAAREICDLIMDAQGLLEPLYKKLLD